MLKYRRQKCAAICKKLPPLRAGAFWQREKDSNPHIRSQSPLCYLYTIPLYRKRKGYYTQFPANVKRNRQVFFEFLLFFRAAVDGDALPGAQEEQNALPHRLSEQSRERGCVGADLRRVF